MTATLDSPDVDTDDVDDVPATETPVEVTEPTAEEAVARLAEINAEIERLKGDTVAEVAYWRFYERRWCESGALAVLEDLKLADYGAEGTVTVRVNVSLDVHVPAKPGVRPQTNAAAAKSEVLEHFADHECMNVVEVYAEQLSANASVLSAERARQRQEFVEQWRREDNARREAERRKAPVVHIVPDPKPWTPVGIVAKAEVKAKAE